MDRSGRPILVLLVRFGDERTDLIPPHQSDPAIGRAERTATNPHHLTGGQQRVQVGRLIPRDPGRQDVSLQRGGRQGRALQRGQNLGSPSTPRKV